MEMGMVMEVEADVEIEMMMEMEMEAGSTIALRWIVKPICKWRGGAGGAFASEI